MGRNLVFWLQAPVDSEADSYEAEISAIRSSYTINSLSRYNWFWSYMASMRENLILLHAYIKGAD